MSASAALREAPEKPQSLRRISSVTDIRWDSLLTNANSAQASAAQVALTGSPSFAPTSLYIVDYDVLTNSMLQPGQMISVNIQPNAAIWSMNSFVQKIETLPTMNMRRVSKIVGPLLIRNFT